VLALDEITAALGYVVGRKAAAPAGASVEFQLTGDSGRTIRISVGHRAEVVEVLPGPATATLRLPVGTFTRLAGGRLGPAAAVEQTELAGDAQLGRAVLDNLPFTI
jgi:hypothetical protein